MDTTVIVALITAGLALIAAVFSALWTAHSSARLEAFKTDQAMKLALLQGNVSAAQAALSARYTDENAERAAQRDYRYEALKHLYTEVQPLLFQMRGPLRQASDHLLNLARASREGDLGRGPASWWLQGSYYLNATMYRFTLPAAYHRLMGSHLALIDVSLDRKTALVYALLDEYVRAWRADFDLADLIYGKGVYKAIDNPVAADGHDAQQGLFAGHRDEMIDLFLVGKDNDLRARRFGEFETAMRDHDNAATIAPLKTILIGSAPAQRPVLWAILLILGSLAEVIEWVLQQGGVPDPLEKGRAMAEDDVRWRNLSHATDVNQKDVAAMRDLVTKYMQDALDRVVKAAPPGR